MWEAVVAERGIDGRDALWAHAELLPTSDDLDDPIGFATRSAFDLSELDEAQPEDPTT